MRTAKTILTVIQERGKQKKPIERVYKLLFNRELYLNAYAKLYPNNGAMTKGVTDETVDGMSIQKIDRMIEILREEKYQWKPARREYIKKKNGKKRPLGIPVWGDKVLQEVMRQILEAYYEPQFSEHSHGFRPNRGCHTALQEIQVWKGTRCYRQVLPIQSDLRLLRIPQQGGQRPQCSALRVPGMRGAPRPRHQCGTEYSQRRAQETDTRCLIQLSRGGTRPNLSAWGDHVRPRLCRLRSLN